MTPAERVARFRRLLAQKVVPIDRFRQLVFAEGVPEQVVLKLARRAITKKDRLERSKAIEDFEVALDVFRNGAWARAYLGPEMCRARHRAGMTREDYDRTRQQRPPPPSSSSSRKITLSSFPHSLAQPGHNKPPGGSRSSGSGSGGLPPLPVTHARLVGNADYEWHQAVLGEYGLRGPVRR